MFITVPTGRQTRIILTALTFKPLHQTAAMRLFYQVLFLCLCACTYGQYPYVKKLNYPEQLPSQVVYDMLTDSKGYIWLATDKGLFRFNGRTFVNIPFDNTSSRQVGYLQEDRSGTIWCMNFYNQPFYFNRDTLRRFVIRPDELHESTSFSDMVVTDNEVWLHTFSTAYAINKRTHLLSSRVTPPVQIEQIVTAALCDGKFFAYTPGGYMYSGAEGRWKKMPQGYVDCRLIPSGRQVISIGAGYDRHPAQQIGEGNFAQLKAPRLPANVYVIRGSYLGDNEYWLCTQNGAYRWDIVTGEAKCFLPGERVSDVVKDYQGNYWFSTLDNGVFVCSSLNNSFLRVYKDPLMDNFTRIAALPGNQLVVGNSQGLLSKIDLSNQSVFQYDLIRLRETEFILYDTAGHLVISNRGVLRPNEKKPVELIDFSKGVQRDRFGNLIVAMFNEALVINDHFNSMDRKPAGDCALYRMLGKDTENYLGRRGALRLRKRRSVSVLSSRSRDAFWVGYDDGLYEYHYDGTIHTLTDSAGRPVVAKSLQEQPGGVLVAGASTRGVMLFRNGRLIRNFNEKNGLSSAYVKKVLVNDGDIWVLTDAGLDRINTATGAITNYLEEYGLSSTIINDFILCNGNIIFATPSGILIRKNEPANASSVIKFPLLRAASNGAEVRPNGMLAANKSDITFYFEALHYLSTTALSYRYRVIGIDTIWRSGGNFTNQITLNRLSPGKYVFEIRAVAGAHFKSAVRSFAFRVDRPFWQKAWFILPVVLLLAAIVLLSLLKWKKNVLQRQLVREQVLKSQLVALRAQMNPHFLYNVLNTVQGLVYGNRKTEAGELLGNFSDLMRKTLQASDRQFLTVKDEIENLRLYLELEKARFDEGFHFSIEVRNIADLSSVYIPSLLLQPFAENSVKHGLMHKKGRKNVQIVFKGSEEGLSVVIEDNGIGRAQSMEINKRSKNKPFSFATAAISERIHLFNRLYRQQIRIDITDMEDEHRQPAGTRVEIFIPYYGADPMAL